MFGDIGCVTFMELVKFIILFEISSNCASCVHEYCENQIVGLGFISHLDRNRSHWRERGSANQEEME
jgi:hypothetical protein